MHESHALVIGINRYPLIIGRDLAGCVNDATAVSKLLKETYGFREQNVQHLLDEQATRAAILDAMDALVERSGEGDSVVFFYAGHGSQIETTDASKLSGWDETLVPHDSGRSPYKNCDIRDGELRVRLLRLLNKRCFVTLIFDCCHSATLHRDSFAATERGVPPDGRSAPLPDGGGLAASLASRLDADDRYVVIAACRDHEKAKELRLPANPSSEEPALVHGALTYFLIRTLSEVGGSATYQQIFEQAAAYLVALFPSQNPCCEGARSRVFLGCDVRPIARVVRVSTVNDELLTLTAGLAEGASVGSIWAIESALAEQDPGLRAEVIAAGATQARAQLLAKSIEGAAIARVVSGSRAVLIERPLTTRWPIEIADSSDDRALIAKLRERVSRSPWLRLHGTAVPAQACIYLVPPRQIEPTTAPAEIRPAPQVTCLEHASFVAVGADGELLLRPIASTKLEEVQTALERRAKQSLVRELQNSPSSLSGKVTLQVLCAKNGAWSPAHADARDVPSLMDGTQVILELTNRHTALLYAIILYLDCDGGIAQVYPPRGGFGAIGPGRSGRIGAGEGESLILHLPQPPWVTGAFGAESIEDFKLIVSTQPLDFTPLLEAGFAQRAATGGGTGLLEQLFAGIMSGHSDLRGVPIEPPADQDFFTDLRRVRIISMRLAPGDLDGLDWTAAGQSCHERANQVPMAQVRRK